MAAEQTARLGSPTPTSEGNTSAAEGNPSPAPQSQLKRAPSDSKGIVKRERKNRPGQKFGAKKKLWVWTWFVQDQKDPNVAVCDFCGKTITRMASDRGLPKKLTEHLRTHKLLKTLVNSARELQNPTSYAEAVAMPFSDFAHGPVEHNRDAMLRQNQPHGVHGDEQSKPAHPQPANHMRLPAHSQRRADQQNHMHRTQNQHAIHNGQASTNIPGTHLPHTQQHDLLDQNPQHRPHHLSQNHASAQKQQRFQEMANHSIPNPSQFSAQPNSALLQHPHQNRASGPDHLNLLPDGSRGPRPHQPPIHTKAHRIQPHTQSAHNQSQHQVPHQALHPPQHRHQRLDIHQHPSSQLAQQAVLPENFDQKYNYRKAIEQNSVRAPGLESSPYSESMFHRHLLRFLAENKLPIRILMLQSFQQLIYDLRPESLSDLLNLTGLYSSFMEVSRVETDNSAAKELSLAEASVVNTLAQELTKK